VSLMEDWSIVVPNAVIDTCNKESTDTDTERCFKICVLFYNF
jgi:hypothetical protein